MDEWVMNVLMGEIDEMNGWNDRMNGWDEWTDDRTIFDKFKKFIPFVFFVVATAPVSLVQAVDGSPSV